MRQALTKIQLFDLHDRSGYFKLRIAILGQIARDKRRAFERWVHNDTQQGVLEDVKTGGKAAKAMFACKKRLIALATMISEDKNDRRITLGEIIKKGKIKHQYIMHKTVMRLFL